MQPDDVLLPSPLYGNEDSKAAGGVAEQRRKGQRRVAERQLLAMHDVHVARRERALRTLRRKRRIPVFLAHHHPRPIGSLQIVGAASVIGLAGMTMRHYDVLDLR